MTNKQISKELLKISKQMDNIADDMIYFGGLGEMGKHGSELKGAAKIAKSWAGKISKLKR